MPAAQLCNSSNHEVTSKVQLVFASGIKREAFVAYGAAAISCELQRFHLERHFLLQCLGLILSFV